MNVIEEYKQAKWEKKWNETAASLFGIVNPTTVHSRMRTESWLTNKWCLFVPVKRKTAIQARDRMHTYADAATLVHWTCYTYFYHIHPSFYIIKLFLNYKLQWRKGAQNMLEKLFSHRGDDQELSLQTWPYASKKWYGSKRLCGTFSLVWRGHKWLCDRMFFKNGGAGYSLSVCLVIFILHNVRNDVEGPF